MRLRSNDVGTELHVGLLITAFGFGFRHRIDWDHIAALTDLTSTQDHPRRSMFLATLYAIGHAAVVFMLGFAAIVLAARLPATVDNVMERFVGATLLMLGAYVVIALARQGAEFRMRSRWMLLGSSVRHGVARLRGPELLGVVEHEVAHHDGHIATLPRDPFSAPGSWTALLIGMLHGIGAETPTQVLIFVSAAGIAGKGGGLVLLACFLVGLFTANTAVALVSTFGLLHATRNFHVYASISLVTAAFSIVTGLIFALGSAGSLPALLGG